MSNSDALRMNEFAYCQPSTTNSYGISQDQKSLFDMVVMNSGVRKKNLGNLEYHH